MTVFLNSKPVAAGAVSKQADGTLFVFATQAEAETAIPLMVENRQALESCREYSSTRYDYGIGFDYMILNVPDFNNLDADGGRVEIYYSKARLLFLHQDVAVVDSLAAELKRHTVKDAAGVLYRFFMKLIENDGERLDDIEEKIADLEDGMVAQPPRDCTEEISAFRRDLLVLKRYYEAFFALLQDMEENQNQLFDEEQLHILGTCTDRVDRLMHTVLHLRDYVTQVRESYQAQLDISLNQTMKFLTVVTTIFSPLTLLVGWYGMNLIMPEFNSPLAYPAVIVVSLVIVLVSIVFFKRKNWF